MNVHIEQRRSLSGSWGQIRTLLDTCYPLPPRDVFYRVIEQYREGYAVWLALTGDDVVGMVMLIPNSKGGTLETLAVCPEARGQGIGGKLVDALLENSRGIISLTTRIPEFFERKGFRAVTPLDDESIFMVCVLPTKSPDIDAD